MFNEANHASRNPLQYRFWAVQIYFDPHYIFSNVRNRVGAIRPNFDSNETAKESAVSLSAVATAYDRTLQALPLRDVRHLLPADGVPTVDAVLDYSA